jgi:hypothetical protein
MSQDLLEVLSDIEYLVQNQGIDVGLGYEVYKQTILEKCIAPNKFFADHPEYLYQIVGQTKTCLLPQYTQVIQTAGIINSYLDKCFKEGEFLGCSRQLLNSISKLPTDKLVVIAEPLEKTNLEAGIINILAKRGDYYPSTNGFAGHLLAKFKTSLDKGLFNVPVINILEKYFTHNKDEALDVSLLKIVERAEVDELLRLISFNKIIGDLASGKLHLSSSAYGYIEDSLFKKHKISVAHDVSEEQLGKLVILFYGVANDDYIASDELLMFAEKYAEAENPELSEPAKSCMWKMYQYIIESPGKEDLLVDINKKLIEFFIKGYQIPEILVEAALKERFGYFAEFFLKLVVARELPAGIWPGVEKAVVDFLSSEETRSSFTTADVNINTNEANEIFKSSSVLQSLFILKRVYEREELINPKTLSTQLLQFIFNDFKPGESEKFREIVIDYYHAMCREVQLSESAIEKFFETYLKVNNMRTLAQLNTILSAQKLNNLHQEKLDLYYEIKKGQATETTFNRWEFITKYGSNVTKARLLEKTGFCINELTYKNEFLYTACWAHKAVSIQKIYDQESAKIWENDYTSRYVLNEEELILLKNKLYRLSSLGLKLKEFVYNIDFLEFSDLLDFLDLILDNQIHEGQFIPVLKASCYTSKEAYALVNKILLERSVEKIFALEKFHVEEKSFWRNVDKALKLGWQFESFLEPLLKVRVKNSKEIQAFLGAMEYIASYEIIPFLYDHEFSYAKEVFELDNDKWLPKLQQIIRDNSFYFAKKQQELLNELKESNKFNQRIKQLIEDKYFEDQLDNIAKIKFADELPNNSKPLSGWQKEDFLNWRAGIIKIDDNNINEVLGVLNQAVKIAHGFYLREVQLLSILSLFKSPTGGIAEIATGEGKTIIVAVFAALKVIVGHQVDVVTSSRVLAIRDSEEQQEFYNLLGISAAHNIDGTTTAAGGKKCYQADVVYGDMLYLVGDTLRDITYNVKEGRSFDILLVDEADSLFIDNTDMMVQLASAMPGFDMFKAVQLYSWYEAGRLGEMLEPDATEKNCYKKIEENISWQDFNATLLNITALNDTQNYNENVNYTESTEKLNEYYAKYNATYFNATEDANEVTPKN